MPINATRFSNSWFEDVHLADKPYIVGKNNIVAQVNQSNSGWYAGGSNVTDSTVFTNAMRRLYDGFGNLSVGTSTGATTYEIRLESTTSIVLDTATLIGHNFPDLTTTGTITAKLKATDGTTTVQIADTQSVTSSSRLTFSHLYDAGGNRVTHKSSRSHRSGADRRRTSLESSSRSRTSIRRPRSSRRPVSFGSGLVVP